MLVGDLGEFALIDRIAASIKTRNEDLATSLDVHGAYLDMGIGDDAASWMTGEGLTVSTMNV